MRAAMRMSDKTGQGQYDDGIQRERFYLHYHATTVQGCSKSWAPGFVKKRQKSCVLLPAEGKQNVTFSPKLTQPGTQLNTL